MLHYTGIFAAEICKLFSLKSSVVMKFIVALVFSFISLSAFSQKEVSINDLSGHVGDSVVVTSTVYGGRFLSGNSLTLLNMGAAYPNQLLTVVIRGDDRTKFDEAPETLFHGKDIQVKGKVEMYNGKPQIVVTTKEQIDIILKKEEWRD